MTSLSDQDLLKTKIQAAFSGVPVPAKKCIFSDLSRDEEAIFVKNFGGLSWEAIPLEGFGDYYACIHCFTPEGLRQYLPTFMIFSINNCDQDDIAVDSVICLLAPSDEYVDYAIWQLGLLSEEEIQVCQDYVTWMLKQGAFTSEDTERAISVLQRLKNRPIMVRDGYDD